MQDVIADTALSMAESLLVSAIGKAASAATKKMSLVMGVRKDIWFIKDELETMQAFLVAAEAMKEKDMLLKVWAKQARDLSNNIEDCVGEFMVHVVSPSRLWKLMKLKDRHRVAMQIRGLKSRVEQVSSRNTRYNLIQKNQITRAIDERDSCMEDIRNRSASNIDEAELVGLSKPKKEALYAWSKIFPDGSTPMHFTWSTHIADKLGVPCVAFNVMGAFPMLAVRHLVMGDVAIDDDSAATVPRFPAPPIRIPRAEFPDFLMRGDYGGSNQVHSMQAACFGLAINTFADLERHYCKIYTRQGYVKRAYFLGPLSLQQKPSLTTADSLYIDWLDTKPDHSVVYLAFGSLAHVSDAQLDKLALGLEASGKSFMWVVRAAEKWTPPEGWEKHVEDRGIIIRTWAPQTAILAHSAVGAFVTQCGWNSVLEAVVAGVPMLTWPKVYEQFITERLVMEVLKIGERLWPHGAGLRSENFPKHELIPTDDVARALIMFMDPAGPGDRARRRVMDLASKYRAAMAEGGSSHHDLHRMVNDLMAARGASSFSRL